MNKLGIRRLYGMLISFAVVVAAFVLFNFLPYIQMNEDLYNLEAEAQRYDNDYKIFLQRNNELKKYRNLIAANSDELDTLKNILNKNSLRFSESNDIIRYSGIISLDALSEILNYLSVTKELKVNTLDFKSQTELPLLIGEDTMPNVFINKLEVEKIKINEQVLGG